MKTKKNSNGNCKGNFFISFALHAKFIKKTTFKHLFQKESKAVFKLLWFFKTRNTINQSFIVTHKFKENNRDDVQPQVSV